MGYLITASIITAQALLEGICVSLLWGWFMVPLFDLPSIGVAGGIGMAVLGSLLSNSAPPAKSSDEALYRTLLSFVNPVLLLAIGYIAHLFM